MKTNVNGRLFAGALLAGTTIILGACVSNTCPNDSDTVTPTFVTDATVNITFDKDGCPLKAKPKDFFVTNSKKVIWQSVDEDGKDISAHYAIYFDPFRGKTLETEPGSKGQVKSPRFDPDAPKSGSGVVYEYTIVGEDCKDKPLDPRFRLR